MSVLVWFWRRRAQALTLLAAIALALFSSVMLPWAGIIFGTGIVLGILALWSEGGEFDRNQALAESLGKAESSLQACGAGADATARDARRSLDEVLLAVIGQCGGEPGTVRASVYFRREEGWVRVSRYSSNAAFRDSGRVTIALGQGLLQRAFERSTAEANDLPDPARAPTQYEREQVRLGLLPGTCASFTMASRSYAVFRIEGRPTERPIQTYVLCLESTEPWGVVLSALSEALSDWLPAMHRTFVAVL